VGPKRRAIFLDRDGTVIRGISRPELGQRAHGWAPWHVNEIQFEPNLREAMRIFWDFGYMTILATNQPDVAHGFLPYARWERIFKIILREVQPHYFYWCPHTREDGCDCKKPKPGMLRRAAAEWNINLEKSFMIGDTVNDVLAGRAAGCKTILIRRPYNHDVKADIVVPSLLAATAVV